MGRIQSNQDGLGLHVVIIAIFIATVVGFAGMRVISKDTTTKPSQTANSTETPKTTQPEATVVPAVPTETKVEVPTVYKIPRTTYSVSYPSGWKVGSFKEYDKTEDGINDGSWTQLEGSDGWSVYLTTYVGGYGGYGVTCKSPSVPFDENMGINQAEYQSLPNCPTYTQRKVLATSDDDLSLVHLSSQDVATKAAGIISLSGQYPVGVENANQCVFVTIKDGWSAFNQKPFSQGKTTEGTWSATCAPDIDLDNGPTTTENQNIPSNLAIWIRFPGTLHNATDFSFEDQQGFQEAVAILASLKKD